ncbi:PRK06851 family protein [Fervidibacillus halotolerans]|uniref:PRK06851 family protein n=1 Tax=Fervidibacillus halotolerans TaxID=2980027 RepID=A0A9E8S1V0_9BACI|nr:PRK06851 family protein [Fervidibacillus halotolerans]WAA13892.1 PRK06851 family protein [Fervidibacillus halotolerans]
MKGKEINYFGGGNTAYGFVHYFETNFQQLNRLFILKGGPGIGKSTIMKSIGNEWNEKGYDVEWIRSTKDVDLIDGLIIPQLKVGIVDGTDPYMIEPRIPIVVGEYVNLDVAYHRDALIRRKEDIIHLFDVIQRGYKSVYETFQRALKEHDQLESYYIKEINRDKADQLTNEWIKDHIPEGKRGSNPVEKHRFLGASTPNGPIDFVENITETITNRYFIKGRPGSGKSTMLKKIAKAALNQGYTTEIYHCGFDPKSLDMVIVRELDWAIFDSTAPHEYFPSKTNDTILDLYALTITPGTDEKYASDIQETTERYKRDMKKGIEKLKEVKQFEDKLKEIYDQASNFTTIQSIRKQLNDELIKEEKTL